MISSHIITDLRRNHHTSSLIIICMDLITYHYSSIYHHIWCLFNRQLEEVSEHEPLSISLRKFRTNLTLSLQVPNPNIWVRLKNRVITSKSIGESSKVPKKNHLSVCPYISSCTFYIYGLYHFFRGKTPTKYLVQPLGYWVFLPIVDGCDHLSPWMIETLWIMG